MKKILLVILSTIFLSFSPFSKPKIGIEVQDITIINFWSSDNAESRRINVILNNYCNKNNIDFISISFDKNEKIGYMISKSDGIDNVIVISEGFDSEIAKSLKIIKYQYCIVDNNHLYINDYIGRLRKYNNIKISKI